MKTLVIISVIALVVFFGTLYKIRDHIFYKIDDKEKIRKFKFVIREVWPLLLNSFVAIVLSVLFLTLGWFALPMVLATVYSLFMTIKWSIYYSKCDEWDINWYINNRRKKRKGDLK